MTRKDYTLDEFKSKIDSYFKACTTKNTFPSLQGMYIYFNLTEDEYREYFKVQTAYHADFAKLDEFARLRRCQWLQQKMIDDPKMQAVCTHLLKQPENGGQGAEGKSTGPKTIVHKMEGIKSEDVNELFG